jgi:hypothetical protein
VQSKSQGLAVQLAVSLHTAAVAALLLCKPGNHRAPQQAKNAQPIFTESHLEPGVLLLLLLLLCRAAELRSMPSPLLSPVPLSSYPPLPLLLLLLLQAWQARRSPAGQQGWSCLH